MNSELTGGMAAIFPWVSVKEPVQLGSSIRLIPYRVGKLPGDLPHATQQDLDMVMKAYSNRPNVRVRAATILEVDHWQTGMQDPSIAKRLFRARTAIGFAALAHRRLFNSHFGYCCYDTYSLIVQRYKVGDAEMFSFSTRRRDGSTGHMWGSDEFAFQRPLHVDSRAQMNFDHGLAPRLFELPAAASEQIFEALVEFNSANTDSGDVPQHVEVVMMKSAFEWLLKINQDAKEFVRALGVRLLDVAAVPIEAGPLQDKWRTKYPNAARPLEGWAREFCDLRGSAAHGKTRNTARHIWKPHVHLAFASVLFPLLVKKQLGDAGHWSLSDFDAQKLRLIESYLMHDPFAHDPIHMSGENPWNQLDGLAFIAANASKWYQSPPA